MKNTVSPPIVVVEKVLLGESLPGIDELCKRVKTSIIHTLKKSAQARLDALLIARQIFEYAARAEVQARVAVLNVDPATGKRREGREKTAHRLAMDVLAAKCGVSIRTVDNWDADWRNVSGALKLKLNCAEEDVLKATASHVDDLYAWLDSLHAETGAPGAKTDEAPHPPPHEIAKHIVSVFEKHFYTKTGHKRLDPDARAQVMQNLNPLLKEIGFEISTLGAA